MATQNRSKLMKLNENFIPGTVMLTERLINLGISRDLISHYLSSGWLTSIGRGAYKKPGDNIKCIGGLFALQKQKKLNVHVGAVTALSLHGYSHYVRFGEEEVTLFSPNSTRLPKWFVEYDWGEKIYHKQTSFLPLDIGIENFNEANFSFFVSSPERAIIECLYLAPKKVDLVECFHLMEGLVNLRPKLCQQLLLSCNSIKAKRLFLYLANKVNHQWVSFFDISKIDLGSGNRRISETGVYVSNYQITIPRELAEL